MSIGKYAEQALRRGKIERIRRVYRSTDVRWRPWYTVPSLERSMIAYLRVAP